MSHSLAGTAASGAKWISISSAAGVLFSILQISIVARFLAPEDFGLVAVLVVIIEICNVFVRVGLADVLVSKREATKDQLSTLYWAGVLVGFSMYLVLCISSQFFVYFFQNSNIGPMARVMGIILIIGSFTVQFEALMRRDLHFSCISIFRIVASFIGLVVAVWLATSGWGGWALIYAAISSELTMSLLLVVFAIQRKWFPALVFNLDRTAEYLRFGAYRVGASLINTLNSRVDQLAVGAFFGPAALGYYSLAFNLAMQPFLKINPVLTQVSFPIFSKIKNDDVRLLKGYRKGLRLITFVNAPLLLGLAVTAPHLVRVLLGPNWESVIRLVQILAVGVIFRSAANINIGLVLAKEKYRWPFYWNLILLFIVPSAIISASIVSSSILLLSSVVAALNVLFLAAGYFIFPKRLLGGFGLGFLSDIGRPVLTSVLMACAVYFCDEAIDFSAWIEFGMLVAVGGISYISISFLIQRQHLKDVIEFLRPSEPIHI